MVMAKLLQHQIFIFDLNNNNYEVKDIYWDRIPGQSPKCVFVYFDGEHYEPLNVTDSRIVNKILSVNNLLRQESELIDESFIYKLSSFGSCKEYRDSIKEVKLPKDQNHS